MRARDKFVHRWKADRQVGHPVILAGLNNWSCFLQRYGFHRLKMFMYLFVAFIYPGKNPIEINDLFYKGDLPHIGYTCNRKQKDTYNIMTGVQFTNLFTMTGTRSIKYHVIQLCFKIMQGNQNAHFQNVLQSVPS